MNSWQPDDAAIAARSAPAPVPVSYTHLDVYKRQIYTDVTDINVRMSDKSVHLIRLKDYDFWNKVKTKFL